jgi:gliding motility-associated-like protein
LGVFKKKSKTDLTFTDIKAVFNSRNILKSSEKACFMSGKHTLLSLLAVLGFCMNANAQCPPNIDFEYGTTAFWTFYTGTCCPGGLIDASILTPPINGRHNLMSGPSTDYYGGFPVVDPGGGSFDMRIGYDTINRLAERARYYVNIPAGAVNFDLVYRFAVVIENPPGHTPAQQPKFTVSAYDVTTAADVRCASYTYVADSSLAGFVYSPVRSRPSGALDVQYKDWTTATLNLSGLAGHTIAIDVAAGDCDLTGHFGYGYFDMTCGLFAVSGVTCNDTATTVTLSAPFGYAGYHWYDSATFTTLFGATQTITLPMPPGVTHYAVILTPFFGYGCPDTLYTTVSPSHLTLSPTPDTIVCNGSGATITSGATDVALPLTYSWSPAAGLSCTNCATPVASPLTPTVYTVTVTNVLGCQKSTTVRVALGRVTSVTTHTDNACWGGATATGTDVVTAGVPPFAYVWSTVPVQTTSRATGLAAGTYSVTVTDIIGCSDMQAVTIGQGPRTHISVVGFTNPDSCDIANGTITLDSLVPGATFTVRYLFNGIPQTRILTADAAWHVVITNLGRGNVTNITVDPNPITNNCPYNTAGPVTLIDPPYPYRPVMLANSPCVGAPLNLSGATTSDSTVYLWNGPVGFVSVISNPAIVPTVFDDSGMYYVVLDRKNCFVYDSIMVHILPLPFPNITTNTPVCSGDTLFLHGSSSNGATSYSWVGPNSFVSYKQDPFIDKSQIAATGVYTLTVALNGCFAVDTMTAVVNQTPAAPVVTDLEYCQGSTAAPLTPGGAGYLWYTSATGGVGSLIPPTPPTTQTGTTSWYVTQVSPEGCEGSRAKINVQVDYLAAPVLDLSDSVICKGTSILLTASGTGDDMLGIRWDFGYNDTILNVNPVKHSFDHANAPEDSMLVTATAYYKVCPTQTVSRMIRVYESPDVYLGRDTTICPGGVAFVISDVNNAGKKGATWKWNTGETGSSIVITQPGTYYVRAAMNGCYSTDTVVVANDCYINYPNVFTPNGDGMNDYFFPRNLLTRGLTSFKMDIYNRWGQLVFTTNSLDGRGWDGKFNDKDQPQGVFVYMIDATFKDGQKEHHTGNVTLIR